MNKKKWILPILLPVQILLIHFASKNSAWIEANYSQAIYPKIATTLRAIFSVFPFSVGDILYVVVAINIVAFIIKKVRKRKVTFIEAIRKSLVFASIIYFVFHAFWGLNYYRKPLHTVLNIENDYNTERLESVTLELLKKSNNLHAQIEPIDSLSIKVPYTTEQIFERTSEAYEELQKVFPKLNYSPRSIKKSMLSVPLTYMGFSGYLNPFTNEAQVNRLILPYKMPTTSCHEEAHQLGFAKENEANFIGVMACMNSSDKFFNYSGYTFALRYCLHELYLRDYQKFICIKEKIRPGILKNFDESRKFWAQYDNPLEPFFKLFYGQFLKVNNQAQGIKSYNYVVALFVNYFLSKDDLKVMNEKLK